MAQLHADSLVSLAGWFVCCIKTPLQIGRLFIIEWDDLCNGQQEVLFYFQQLLRRTEEEHESHLVGQFPLHSFSWVPSDISRVFYCSIRLYAQHVQVQIVAHVLN
jgi:hypothetical protein